MLRPYLYVHTHALQSEYLVKQGLWLSLISSYLRFNKERNIFTNSAMVNQQTLQVNEGIMDTICWTIYAQKHESSANRVDYSIFLQQNL